MQKKIRGNNDRKTGKTTIGQSMVEFALVLPIMIFLFMGIIEFGRALFTYAQAANALRDSLRYGAITGLDESNPQYANCAAIANQASNASRIWFSSDVVTTITYTHNDSSTNVVVFPPGGACPDPDDLELGERLTVETEVSIDVITPIVSQYTDTLSFSLIGTRTLTAGGITYGAGVETLEAPSNVGFACEPGETYIELEWDDDTIGVVEEWWVFKDFDTIARIPVATAEASPNSAADTSGCTGAPGSTYSCHEDPSDFGDTDPHTYSVRPYASSQGVGPATSASPTNQSCPVPSPPSALSTLNLDSSSCGFGGYDIDLSWTHPDPSGDGVTEYRIYRDNEPSSGGTLVNTISGGSSTSCSNCDPTWAGAATTYYVVPFNGQEAATPNLSVSVPVCSGISALYLQDTQIADDGNSVPSLADESNAMNLACGSGLTPYSMNSYEEHHWLTQAYPAADTLSAGNYSLVLDLWHNPGSTKTMTYDITLAVCNIGGTSCTTAGSASYTFSSADPEGGPPTTISLNVPSDVPVSAFDRLHLTMENTSVSGGSPWIGVKVEGVCGAYGDSRLVFP